MGMARWSRFHDYLLRALRDKAQAGLDEFREYLTETARDIEATWSSNKSLLAS